MSQGNKLFDSIIEIKCDKHLVIKKEDIKKYLSKRQCNKFIKLVDKINEGRQKDGRNYNNYYVCNKDEPYADEVIYTILNGEILKRQDIQKLNDKIIKKG